METDSSRRLKMASGKYIAEKGKLAANVLFQICLNENKIKLNSMQTRSSRSQVFSFGVVNVDDKHMKQRFKRDLRG